MRGRYRKRSHKLGNSVIHVPSTIAGSLASVTSVVLVIASPSIDAADSASQNIEAQDKDRTINVGHHMGMVTITFSVRTTAADGIVEWSIYKVERHSAVPVLGTHPVPSSASINSVGIQQATRLSNPGKVFHVSKRAYTIEQNLVHTMKVRPAKFNVSKWKAGDYLILQVFNRGAQSITYDFEARYKEYE